MAGFARDLRYAVRTLARMRAVAVLAIATLALGIGATTTMFSVVHAMLLRPPPFADPDRLVILFNTRTSARDGLQRLRWSLANVTALEQAATSFDRSDRSRVRCSPSAAAASPRTWTAKRSRAGISRRCGCSRSRVACSLPARTPPPAPSQSLIGAALWKRTFGSDPTTVGSSLIVNDVPLTIVGILPDGFTGLSGKADIWIAPPMAARLYYADYQTTPQNFISAIARLKDGVSLEQANAELAAIGPRFIGNGSTDDVWGAVAVSFTKPASCDRQAVVARSLAAAGCARSWPASTSPACCLRGRACAAIAVPPAGRSAVGGRGSS
jgi:hypothetical protein